MTNVARPDLFTPIHKTIRRVMFETAIQLARTDFNAGDDVAAATRAAGDCLAWMREHAEHEDRVVIPELARFDAVLAGQLEAEHPALERLAIDVDCLWPRLAAAEPGLARAQLGGELHRRFLALVAAQLRHMDREEREVNAVLWANLGDQDLLQINRRIVSGIAPERLRQVFPVMEASLNRPERELLAAARAAQEAQAAHAA
jgi:hypothetical protein